MKVFNTPSFLGFPPDKLNTVNCSSGYKITNSGPKTTLVSFNLKSNTYTAVLNGILYDITCYFLLLVYFIIEKTKKLYIFLFLL